MRVLWVLLLAAGLLAGCLGEGELESGETDDDRVEDEEPRPALPAAVDRSFMILAGFDIPPPDGEEVFCWMPSHGCVEEPFSLPAGGVTVKAHAEWGLDANNLGLFLYRGDEVVTYDSGPRPTGTTATFEHTLGEAGDYRLVIDPHWAVAETVSLTASLEWV